MAITHSICSFVYWNGLRVLLCIVLHYSNLESNITSLFSSMGSVYLFGKDERSPIPCCLIILADIFVFYHIFFPHRLPLILLLLMTSSTGF